MQKIDWRGVFPALTTKFNANGEIDWDSMARHLEFQLEAGVHGLIVLGSLGENSTLSMDEKLDIVRFMAEQDRRDRPLVACIAESSTRKARFFAGAAADAGADGFMLLPPMRYASDRRETMAYLSDVAAASNGPIMLYNNPIAYGTDLTPEDFARLGDNPKFEAIKESAADTRRFGDIRRLCGDRFALFCGVDDLAFECFALGAVGWVAGLVVAFPRETVRLWELCMAGRWNEARDLYDWFLPLLHLDVGPKFVQQIKLVEALVGVGSAKVRAPRMQLAEAEATRVEAILAEALEHRPQID
ncbi:MAG: dihydrodipicolinate synthase family protein [Xanthomonadales bacterium]|nr:dihydrodipicolinate synthase family protein [Gammaproteobacteria bacterium]MBT8051820.1 dihydrodipicolinate synthase family protein [Gammaproteobacteria bacterium]MBT8057805.1 dihydrodipicolinate synthase family protein [Gammaproteobacteria bacterium]NNJ77814.1 dihydrodipicolinate synthase family protein [Xanthomonadales bacterium]NNL04647.1 dihydrodipicolinate synthase family protein [Xanthomonadales bacterium]